MQAKYLHHVKARCPSSWSWKSRPTVTVIITAHLLFLPDLFIRTIMWHFIVRRLFRTFFFPHKSWMHFVCWTQAKSKMAAERNLLHEIVHDTFMLHHFYGKIIWMTFCTHTAQTGFLCFILCRKILGVVVFFQLLKCQTCPSISSDWNSRKRTARS